MTVQEVFDSATKFYEQSVEGISLLAQALENTDGIDFSADIAIKQFDCILQYVLLGQAAADGKVSSIESQFIKLITQRGDILQQTKAARDLDMTWDKLESLSRSDIVDVLNAMVSEYVDMMMNFVDTIAFADGLIEKVDFYDQIKENTLMVLKCLAVIDGNVANGEVEYGAERFYEIFGKYYVEACKRGETAANN